ncbi:MULTISPECIES: hypothetical protein [Wolbachia]|uniref:hypothetical protein n=1 Tax=Wolbachia TaxID=953 RepID=UPI002174EE85|nr:MULTISPECIES: hypothetical protein [Wolbachia]MDE5060727.1 hypothetical protein [Wolbachia endosymbiont of Drosophila nikananu]
MGPVTNLPSSEENALLIFDFDQTITNNSMCNFFTSKGYDDYDSGKEKAVIKEKIEEFLQKEGSGIKNEEKLNSVLKSALSSGVEVAIVSSAKYIKAVEYVVKNHLGLTEEQAQGIKVVGGTTKRQDPLNSAEVAKRMNEPQDPQIAKHLCVLSLLKAYKKDKGILPQKVMLVDGNQRGINPADDFYKSIKEGLLEKDMKGLLENIDQEIAEVDVREEEINNIAFKGINVSSEPTTRTDGAADDGYLDKVGKWIKEPIQNLENPVDDGPENHIYATIDPSKKTSKESSDSGIDNQSSGMKRSVSQETEFSDPWNREKINNEVPSLMQLIRETKFSDSCDREKSEKDMLEKLNNSLTPSLLESDDTNSEMDSEIPLISPSKKTNRFLPRVKYAIQQKGFIISVVTAVMLSASAALVYLQDKAKFAALFANYQSYITIPVIVLASLLAILPIYLAVKQFRNTEEYQTQGKDADKILDDVLEHQPKDKVMKSVRLEYSNGTHSNFVLNA